MKEFIFIIALLLLTAFFSFYMYKKSKEVFSNSNDKINEIKDEIESISTIEQCEYLKEKIKENYENTDTIFKGVREEYVHLYYIVIGIEKTIKKLIQR